MPVISRFPSSEKTPNYRELPSSWLPSPQAVVEACAAMAAETPTTDLHPLFAQLGIPPLDLSVTPLSARVGLLAAARGQAFFHHELRGRLPMPEALEPERTVWEEGTLPVWEEGILTEPKYFSFFLDTPMSPYNPNYRRKWRAHELLHGVVGFFWHPQMTRFECYLGARLDELLPVIHWYGLDEAFRPRCDKHRGQQLYRDLCPDCEALARPYDQHEATWFEAEKSLAQRWVSKAWTHFDEEWQACLQELDTGLRCETPRIHLNASSDAVGYLYSHWPRLTAWSFGSWAERFLHDGFDYFSTIPAYMQHIANIAQAMVSGECAVEHDTWQRLRTRRVLQDVGYRCFLTLEWFEDGSQATYRAEDALMPLLEQAAHLSHELLTSPVEADTIHDLLGAIETTFHQEICTLGDLPVALQKNFSMLGYLWPETDISAPLSGSKQIQHALPQLTEGLQTGFPQSWSMAEEQNVSVADFAASPNFQTADRLTTRFSRWYGEQPDHDPEVLEWLQFEAWLQESPRRDEDAECFAVLVDDVTDLAHTTGTLRCHHTLRRATWSAALLQQVLGEPVEAEQAALAAIHHNGQQRLMLLDKAMTDLLDTIASQHPLSEARLQRERETLLVLLEHSFVVWFPTPRRP